MIKKISLGDIKISLSGFGVRQLAPTKLSIEAIYQLPSLTRNMK